MLRFFKRKKKHNQGEPSSPPPPPPQQQQAFAVKAGSGKLRVAAPGSPRASEPSTITALHRIQEASAAAWQLGCVPCLLVGTANPAGAAASQPPAESLLNYV